MTTGAITAANPVIAPINSVMSLIAIAISLIIIKKLCFPAELFYCRWLIKPPPPKQRCLRCPTYSISAYCNEAEIT